MMRFGTPGNPLDPTGAVIGDRELLHRMLDVFLADAGFDMVHVAIPAWGAYDARRFSRPLSTPLVPRPSRR